MSAVTSETVADSVRAWARGSDGLESATELLMRAEASRLADPGQPWIGGRRRRGRDWYMLDVRAITDQAMGALPGAERQVRRIVANPGGAPARLDELGCLDCATLDLVLAAIAHAAGTDECSDVAVDPDTATARLIERGGLHPWPCR